ncbi:hypothetical protein [Paraeggerthella hongkongensis]|uniref:Uncharacterized protein n=1 Tax=Paraeggerthella hongkongensis TaxID=230658 RepID=A0A3N0BBM3_9ACTN|nr:hypothetical protein [Paraeggerthella hongkongensis]RNL44760.1 hypothetical protein DMP08_06095 [Paraeggerthella hongkongensis]
MELFEFASQIATPDYVAAKIASCELAISGSQMAVAIELSIVAVCAVAAVAAWRKEKHGGETVWAEVCWVAPIIGAIAAFSMLLSLASIGTGYQTLAAWSNDPVTEVVTRLAAKL